jgi:hypothetical protein
LPALRIKCELNLSNISEAWRSRREVKLKRATEEISEIKRCKKRNTNVKETKNPNKKKLGNTTERRSNIRGKLLNYIT